MQLNDCFPNLDYCLKMKTKYKSQFYFTLQHGENWTLITESSQFSMPFRDLCTVTTFKSMMLEEYEEERIPINKDMPT